MVRIVVVGGGWAGVAAALAAAKAGAEVTLLERTDSLLGTGLVGGIMRNEGRFTAAEEAIAMGGGDFFKVADSVARHTNVNFPGHSHATLYDVAKIEPAVRRVLLERGVRILFQTRATDVVRTGQHLEAIVTNRGQIEGDAFVEATGSAGMPANCTRYGNGCAMCILRCYTFGSRVSLTDKAGIKGLTGRNKKGTPGSMSGSCKLLKESLDPAIVEQLNQTGVAIVPIPVEMQKKDALLLKACQQYALPEYAENIILLDTGHAKMMTSYFPLDKLRQIPGFENARYEDPYSGGIGNSVRYFDMAPRENTMKVIGLENMFVGGEKAGPFVGHTEAIVTGTLAGHNAVRQAAGLPLLEIPTSLAIGDAIAYVGEQMRTEEGLGQKYTFSGSVYLQRMKELGLYTTDIDQIRDRVRQAGMLDYFSRPVL